MTNREFTGLPLCTASTAENDKPLSGQQGNKGLLKAYLWFSVGCVCVCKREIVRFWICIQLCVMHLNVWVWGGDLVCVCVCVFIAEGEINFVLSQFLLLILENVCLFISISILRCNILKLFVQLHFYFKLYIPHIPHFFPTIESGSRPRSGWCCFSPLSIPNLIV